MIYDIGVIGLGVAGVLACYQLTKKSPNINVIGFDIGRPPQKRRVQMTAFLGILPNSDGKLYFNDLAKVSSIVGKRKTNLANQHFNNLLSKIGTFKPTIDKAPFTSLSKKLTKHNFKIKLNDFIQLIPPNIHDLSKYFVHHFEQYKNVRFSYDNEVKQIHKRQGVFVITTDLQEFKCQKLLISVGRSGWRWARDLFVNFGIVENNDTAKYGIRIETDSINLREFNESNCTLTTPGLEIGPFSWAGTVIPEDHIDMAISSYRSNENRWTSEKVSFNFIGHRHFPNGGFEQVDRLAKLTFILTNDRIMKEKVSHLLTRKSKISIIPEYDWLVPAIKQFAEIVPEIVDTAHFHIPTVIPLAPAINLNQNLLSEVENMFVAGESAGHTGLLSAGLMGFIAADGMLK